MKIPKNATKEEITTLLKKENYSDKRIASFLRGWEVVKNNNTVKNNNAGKDNK